MPVPSYETMFRESLPLRLGEVESVIAGEKLEGFLFVGEHKDPGLAKTCLMLYVEWTNLTAGQVARSAVMGTGMKGDELIYQLCAGHIQDFLDKNQVVRVRPAV